MDKMIFKKIPCLVLLVLCTIYTSESSHLAKHQKCSCVTSKSPIEPNHHVQLNNKLHKIFGQLDNPKDQFFETKTPDSRVASKADHQSFPIQNQPYLTSESIYWNPLNYLTSNNYPLKTSNSNLDPNLTEGLLKEMWLSHQLSNGNTPQRQNLNFNPEIQQPKNPLQLQIVKPERRQQTNQPYLRPAPLDEYNFDEQEAFISPPRVPQLAESDVNKQQTNKPSLRLIPLAEYGIDQQESFILLPRVTHISENDVDKQQVILPYPTNPQKYANYDYNIPHKYDSSVFDDIIFDETRYHIPPAHILPNIIKQEPGKFNKWVLEQMEILDSKNQGLDNVDLSGLGYSIFQILNENGMHITNNGRLVDTYGTVFSLNSLNLTPLFIGNTISLKQLLEGKQEVTSSEPITPHLDTILVSGSRPLKIFGVIPLGKKYLPLSRLSSLTNILASMPKAVHPGNSEVDKVVDDKDPEQDETESLYDNKAIKSTHDDTNEMNNSPGQSPHYINVNRNHDSIARSRLFKTLSSRRKFRPEDDLTDDLPYSKQFKVINQEEPETDGGRLFIPHIEFQEQPIDIITSRKNIPVKIVASKIHKPARIHIPGISSLLDITFRSDDPPSKDKITQNNDVEEISDNTTAISDAVKTFSDPTKAAAKQNFLEKKIPASVEESIRPNSRFKIIDDAKQAFKLSKQRLHSILHKANGSNIGQYVPLFEDLGIGSRSGNKPDLSEIPPENFHDGNNAFDLVENDDDDDDDGDFRIIGGNAATGSGTPLSNKGRSGYVF